MATYTYISATNSLRCEGTDIDAAGIKGAIDATPALGTAEYFTGGDKESFTSNAKIQIGSTTSTGANSVWDISNLHVTLFVDNFEVYGTVQGGSVDGNGVSQNSSSLSVHNNYTDSFIIQEDGRLEMYGGSFFARRRIRAFNNTRYWFIDCDVQANDSISPGEPPGDPSSFGMDARYTRSRMHHANAVGVKAYIIDSTGTNTVSIDLDDSRIESCFHAVQVGGIPTFTGSNAIRNPRWDTCNNHLVGYVDQGNVDVELVNPDFLTLRAAEGFASGDRATIEFDYSIVVQDIPGNPLQDAMVKTVDQQGDIRFEELTLASGAPDTTITTLQTGTYANVSGQSLTGTDRRNHKLLVRRYENNWFLLDRTADAVLSERLSLSDNINVTQSRATALAHTGITIVDHGTPVAWEGKNWGITITGDLSVNGSLTADDIYHYFRYYLSLSNTLGGKSGTEWHDGLVLPGFETQRSTNAFYYGGTVKGVRVVDQLGNAFAGFTRLQSDDGTYFLPPATFTFTLSDLVAGSHVYIFDTGTQTVLDSTTSSGTGFVYTGTYTGDQTIDYTVIQAGYSPIRETGILLQDSPVSRTVNMVEDRAYEPSTGLTFGTTATATTGTSRFGLTVASTLQNYYSFMIESWRDETTLRNVEFPLATFGPDSYSFKLGWEWDAQTSIDNLSRDGFRYANGAVTAEWCAVQSLTTQTGIQGRYQQQAGAGTTNALNTGAFDQVIQIFGDATHGNFDYRDHLVLKYQVNGFREARSDVLNVAGVSALGPFLYIVAMEPEPILAATGDPGISITITDEATPVNWNGLDFSITVLDNGANSGEDILREINYNLAQTGSYYGKDTFNWPEMVGELGSEYDTIRGVTEDDLTPALKGVRVIRAGDVAHPDFARFQADNGNYYIPPTTAGVAAPNLTAGLIQLYNVTTDTEIENATITSGYSRQWINGTDFTAGDTIRLRWTAEASLEIESTGVATSADTTVFLDTPQEDEVYTVYGIDGSTVTEYIAAFPTLRVNVNDPDNIFFIDRFYAWWKYTLESPDGIRSFFGGVSTAGASNIIMRTTVVNWFFDNSKAVSAAQGDTIVIQREDGINPVIPVTSGGGGLSFFYQGIGYTATGGSALTPAQDAKLFATSEQASLDLVDAVVNEIANRLDLSAGAPNTYADDNSVISNSNFTLTKTDNGNGTFTVNRS